MPGCNGCLSRKNSVAKEEVQSAERRPHQEMHRHVPGLEIAGHRRTQDCSFSEQPIKAFQFTTDDNSDDDDDVDSTPSSTRHTEMECKPNQPE